MSCLFFFCRLLSAQCRDMAWTCSNPVRVFFESWRQNQASTAEATMIVHKLRYRESLAVHVPSIEFNICAWRKLGIAWLSLKLHTTSVCIPSSDYFMFSIARVSVQVRQPGFSGCFVDTDGYSQSKVDLWWNVILEKQVDASLQFLEGAEETTFTCKLLSHWSVLDYLGRFGTD